MTGASGFVGMRLCQRLVERNWRVVAAHRNPCSSSSIPGCISEYLPLSEQNERWQRALRSADCVIHLAACVHRMRGGRDADAEFHRVNVEGSRFAASEAARAGVKRFVLLSSAKVNGEGDEHRAYHWDDVPDPQDAYSRSKFEAEKIVREISGRTGMEFVIIRSPLVYGPGVRANFERLLRTVEAGIPLPLLSVNNRRSLVGVDNLENYIETCMIHPRAAGRVWLISDGEDLSTPDLLRRLARALHRPARLFSFPPGLLRAAAQLLGFRAEMSRLCGSFTLDATPARLLLDWTPPVGVAEGLERTAAAYRSTRKK